MLQCIQDVDTLFTAIQSISDVDDIVPCAERPMTPPTIIIDVLDVEISPIKPATPPITVTPEPSPRSRSRSRSRSLINHKLRSVVFMK